MSHKQALFIALGTIVGASVADAYFGSFTLVTFAVSFVICVAAALLMKFIGRIGKKQSNN